MVEIKIKDALNHIEEVSDTQKEEAIKDYLKQLVSVYHSNTLNSIQLGYYVTSLIQYRNNILSSLLFSKILKDSSILELPDTQVKNKGYDRDKLTEELLSNIKKYIDK